MSAIDKWMIALVALVALVALLACGSAAWAETGGTVANDACPAISRSVSRLAAAEHQQAFALELYSKAAGAPGPHRGALPMVEVRLAEMLARADELRTTLRRVRAEPGALGDATVGECVTVGEAALRQSEQVSSEVERIVIEGRSYAPNNATPGAVRSAAPVARGSSSSSPGSVSAPAPPGAAVR
ncbi:MAG TPA: hypothetical protein VMV15_15065 [Candidatus Binataceae bacterium]|nr:hypothetical protein [Candidatus Binataceae bacterium]